MDRVAQLEREVAELRAERKAAAVPAAAPSVPVASVDPQKTMPGMTTMPAVDEAERKAAAPPAAASVPVAPMDPQEKMPGMTMPPAVDEANAAGPTLHLAGFADFLFSASDNSQTHSGFSEGQFVLHLSSQLSRHVSYFGELSLTARPDAGLGSPAAPGFNVEVERSIIRYEINDMLKVSFGRYHTPINYWNSVFHHGAWLQTTVNRPEMIAVGGSFLPVHFIGALAEGTLPASGLNLTYNFGIGNGRSDVISRGGDFGDINNNRAWLLNAFVRPEHVYGLQAGASLYRDFVSPIGLPPVHEWIKSAHIVWDKENPEFIAEFSDVSHQPVGGGVASNSQAWYAQIAYRLSPLEHKLKPYYRYEYIHVPKSDAMFRAVPVLGLSGSTAGVRYDVSRFAALKLEYERAARPGLVIRNGIVGQTSFTF
jgi:hypothetical protein